MSDSGRLGAAPDLLTRHWPGEDTGVVYAPSIARTHWVSAEAMAVLQACARPEGAEFAALPWPRETIDGLLAAGLLQRLP